MRKQDNSQTSAGHDHLPMVKKYALPHRAKENYLVKLKLDLAETTEYLLTADCESAKIMLTG